MDRRKSDAKVQLKKLQDECRSTVDLLNTLLETCSTHVTVLDTINSNDFRKHFPYFLAITQFQSESYQKLLQINFDLEEHIIMKEQLNSGSIRNATQDDIKTVMTKPDPLKLDVESVKVSAQDDLKVEKVIRQPDTIILHINEPESAKVHIEEVLTKPETVKTEDNVIVEEVLTKPDAAKVNEPDVEISKCDDKVNINQKQTKYDRTHKIKNLETHTEVKIIDKLKSVSESAVKKKAVLKPIPGISLQATQKKMSDHMQQESVKCSDMKSLVDVEVLTSEEEFPCESTSDLYIHERPPPKVDEFCMIGHINSPSNFYIQVADENSGILDILSTQLESLATYICTGLLKLQAKQILGKFCCIKLDQWYRAEIIDWMLDITGLRQNQVLLQLIDYGGTLHANYKDLCPMLPELCNIPKMAQLCRLDGLHPPGSTRQNILTKWSEESKDGFLNICGDLGSSVFQITHVSQDGNSFAIDMINTKEKNDDNSIGQILFDANLAVEILDAPIVGNASIMNQILMSHGLHNIKPNMTRDEILEMYFSETNMKEARTINEAVMDYDPRDEANTCRNVRADGTCYKGDLCHLLHVPLTDGFTRDKHPVYNKAFIDTPMPSTGDALSLTISHICDIERFYVQIRNKHAKDYDGPTINTLITDMNNSDTVKRYKNLRYPPALSQLVIVKHWNGHWYRGQVKSVTIPENNDRVTVEVWVVDFGDILIVPMSDLRMIMREFLTIPFQAIECRFYNLKHRRGADKAEEKKYFESRYLGQTFEAKIIAVPGYLEVLLYTKDDEDLGEKLIADGYGEEKTDHNFPKDNEMYLVD